MPLIVALQSGTIARAFGLGLLAGGLYFAGTLYWITRVMVLYGNLNVIVAVLINALLVAYLALFPAFFAMVVRRLSVAYGRPALVTVPLVWVATELGRTHLFGGFPWVLLGYSEVSVLPIAQLGSIFGVFGVSGLVTAVNSAIAAIVVTRYLVPRSRLRAGASVPTRKPPVARWPYAWGASMALLLVGITVWGSKRVAANDLVRQGRPIRVGMVQGNVDQGEKWNDERAAAIFGDYLRLTRQAIGEGAQLVLWPESSTPFFFEENRPGAERLRTLARQANVPILIGSDQIEHGVPNRYYNSAFLVRGDGSTAGVYRKIHLVPFGEYVPMKQLLFFASPLVEAVSDFSPGESAVLLPVAGHQMSTAICYEIVYPDLVRQFVAHGSELLTTITNDAWFGRTSAPYQHFAQAAMRAIENGRYLVRSANTGISGIVDPYGRVLAMSNLFETAVLTGEARFITSTTFYTRHGDVFAYACAVLTLLMLLHAILLGRVATTS